MIIILKEAHFAIVQKIAKQYCGIFKIAVDLVLYVHSGNNIEILPEA